MRTMERCQGKPGCENPADRDGCKETRECEKSKRQKATGIGGEGSWGEWWPWDQEAATQRTGRGEPSWSLWLESEGGTACWGSPRVGPIYLKKDALLPACPGLLGEEQGTLGDVEWWFPRWGSQASCTGMAWEQVRNARFRPCLRPSESETFQHLGGSVGDASAFCLGRDL